MKGQVCVVTGGNAGIGKAIVQALAQKQARVVMVSRDKIRGETAVQEVQRAVPQANIDLVLGDVGSIAGTHALAYTLLDSYPHIHVLINNAGVWPTKKRLNEDGLETGFMVNHLAPFMLNQLLRERLQASAAARIVNISAGLYVNGRVDLQKTPYGDDFHPIRTYANTKLCNLLCLPLEAAQLEGSGVTINAVHPGVINTKLGDMRGPLGWLMKLVKRSWAKPAEGAVAPVWLATAPELAETSGKYFNEKEETPLEDVARNDALASQLWQLSLELAKITA
ncbi:SDR family NAD(P)-dependent oxidoreductase [Candidatus Leptofilum sp.]|uniref:SDR family NAD(P)-dependent oxidoreductase n=1 Tax=Candidatus Leptofilum sp. TaxID=3241576 RepID=UPI003B5AD80F